MQEKLPNTDWLRTYEDWGRSDKLRGLKPYQFSTDVDEEDDYKEAYTRGYNSTSE